MGISIEKREVSIEKAKSLQSSKLQVERPITADKTTICLTRRTTMNKLARRKSSVQLKLTSDAPIPSKGPGLLSLEKFSAVKPKVSMPTSCRSSFSEQSTKLELVTSRQEQQQQSQERFQVEKIQRQASTIRANLGMNFPGTKEPRGPLFAFHWPNGALIPPNRRSNNALPKPPNKSLTQFEITLRGNSRSRHVGTPRVKGLLNLDIQSFPALPEPSVGLESLKNIILRRTKLLSLSVSYTHLTLPTIYSV
eukprot:TRINITY_DN1801_c0_g4_i1.p1 TRINITY_DN1801_c0_g4~~TRINITY_DN1801_c0_g4_i1.p1  ORF type:complete len:264 (+),score=32.52 TRINITY_DN1801_c0_g4_i1:42-794(+)